MSSECESDDAGEEEQEPPKEPDDAYFEELDQIQTIIERQANNSFKIKGWAITLVVVVILFRSNNAESLVGFLPLVVFWYLDAYYLRQEKKFRKLHKWVRKNRLETNNHFFDMDPSRFENKVNSTPGIMFSKTQLVFYGMIGLLLIVLFFLSLCTNQSGALHVNYCSFSNIFASIPNGMIGNM